MHSGRDCSDSPRKAANLHHSPRGVDGYTGVPPHGFQELLPRSEAFANAAARFCAIDSARCIQVGMTPLLLLQTPLSVGAVLAPCFGAAAELASG